jgi:hypothetical protein
MMTIQKPAMAMIIAIHAQPQLSSDSICAHLPVRPAVQRRPLASLSASVGFSVGPAGEAMDTPTESKGPNMWLWIHPDADRLAGFAGPHHETTGAALTASVAEPLDRRSEATIVTTWLGGQQHR